MISSLHIALGQAHADLARQRDTRSRQVVLIVLTDGAVSSSPDSLAKAMKAFSNASQFEVPILVLQLRPRHNYGTLDQLRARFRNSQFVRVSLCSSEEARGQLADLIRKAIPDLADPTIQRRVPMTVCFLVDCSCSITRRRLDEAIARLADLVRGIYHEHREIATPPDGKAYLRVVVCGFSATADATIEMDGRIQLQPDEVDRELAHVRTELANRWEDAQRTGRALLP